MSKPIAFLDAIAIVKGSHTFTCDIVVDDNGVGIEAYNEGEDISISYMKKTTKEEGLKIANHLKDVLGKEFIPEMLVLIMGFKVFI